MEVDDVPHRAYGRLPACRAGDDARRVDRGGKGMSAQQRVLVTDTLADSGLAILRAATDIELDYRPGLKGDDLLRAVTETDALITRSGTAVTRELVNTGERRGLLGRGGGGGASAPVDACTERGVLVVNA